jgi:hypothetical protein
MVPLRSFPELQSYRAFDSLGDIPTCDRPVSQRGLRRAAGARCRSSGNMEGVFGRIRDVLVGPDGAIDI